MICNECGNTLFHVICMKNIGLVELTCSECKHVKEITCVAHTTVTLSISAVKPEVQ